MADRSEKGLEAIMGRNSEVSEGFMGYDMDVSFVVLANDVKPEKSTEFAVLNRTDMVSQNHDIPCGSLPSPTCSGAIRKGGCDGASTVAAAGGSDGVMLREAAGGSGAVIGEAAAGSDSVIREAAGGSDGIMLRETTEGSDGASIGEGAGGSDGFSGEPAGGSNGVMFWEWQKAPKASPEYLTPLVRLHLETFPPNIFVQLGTHTSLWRRFRLTYGGI